MSDTPHVHLPKDSNSKRLLTAFLVTAVFMVAEVVGGLLSGSLALLADAGHMLTDAAALLVALMAVHFSQRKPNARHTFGYLRLTTLAAFLNAAALLVIVVFILWEAIRRFFEPQPVMGTPMLIIAIAGLLANLFAFWLLHRGSEEKNINVRAAALHVLGDLLGSVGAIVAQLTEQWLALLGLDGARGDAPFHSLSWGQQRLALIARALVKHPALLILDEPLQGLDPLNRQLVRRFIDVLIGQGATQLLFVSHHAEDAPQCITHRLSFVPDGEGGYGYQHQRLEAASA